MAACLEAQVLLWRQTGDAAMLWYKRYCEATLGASTMWYFERKDIAHYRYGAGMIYLVLGLCYNLKYQQLMTMTTTTTMMMTLTMLTTTTTIMMTLLTTIIPIAILMIIH